MKRNWNNSFRQSLRIFSQIYHGNRYSNRSVKNEYIIRFIERRMCELLVEESGGMPPSDNFENVSFRGCHFLYFEIIILIHSKH